MRWKKNLKTVTFLVIVYYLITVVGFHVLLFLFPEAMAYLPVGGIDRLNDVALSGQGIVFEIVESGVEIKVLEFRSLTLLVTLIAVLIFTVSLAWVYDVTQSIHKHRRNPLIEALYLLPIVAASVVVIVQNSIALAIGLAGGVSEIGIAGVASMFFGLTVLGLRHFHVVRDEYPADPAEAAQDVPPERS